MRRGDIFAAAPPGDYGKPRPVLIIQSDAYAALPSVTVLPLTSGREDAPLLRVAIACEAGNGLRLPSQVMIDKPVTLPRSKIRQRIGALDAATLRSVEAALARFLGLA